jgi:hypothetical protein
VAFRARARVTADEIEALAARFGACEVPAAEWTHAAHLRVGAWHVARFGPDQALLCLRAGIRRLNERHGTGNSATRGYHETITAAYVRLIAAHLTACPAGMPLAERVQRLMEGPLAAKDVLLRFYSRAALASPRARQEWVEPDLAALPPPATTVAGE